MEKTDSTDSTNLTDSTDSIDIIKDIFDMTIIDDTKFVAPQEHTSWIAFSSLFFMIPSIYGFYNEEYFMSGVLCLLSITSFNFWRKPNYSWRRIVDRIYAKIAFAICFINGIRYYYLDPLINSSCVAFITFVYFYYMSNKFCNDKFCNNMQINPCWWKYHMVFHFLATYVQIIVIKSMIDYETNLKI
jgi:hypothetical protein